MICFRNFFCINKNTFLLLLILFIIFFVYLYNQKIKGFNIFKKLNKKIKGQKIRLNNIQQEINNNNHINDPLSAPEYSYPGFRRQIVKKVNGVPINVKTRGETRYQAMGTLTHLDDVTNETTIYPLYGKPTYSSSSKFNYFTQNDKYNPIKIPININGRKCTDENGCNELSDNDTINLHNKDFKVEMYGLDAPKYIPYVY